MSAPGGRVGGRPSVVTPERLREARRTREARRSIVQIAEVLGVGKASVACPREERTDARWARVLRGVNPYEAPTSLDELTGSATRTMELDFFGTPRRKESKHGTPRRLAPVPAPRLLRRDCDIMRL